MSDIRLSGRSEKIQGDIMYVTELTNWLGAERDGQRNGHFQLNNTEASRSLMLHCLICGVFLKRSGKYY